MKTMKIVTLAMPTTVHDVLRHPIEGSLTVSEDEAKRLKDNGKLIGDPIDAPTPAEPTPAVPADLAGKKPAELKALALKEGVPLHDATMPEAIIAAFVAHRTKEA